MSAEETIFNLREKLFSEPATLFTIVTAISTIYGYVYGYQYELGVLAAYKIPDSFAHVDVALIIQSTFDAVGFLVFFILGAIFFMKQIDKIKSPHRKNFIGFTIWLLFLYIVMNYLFDRQSLLGATEPLAFILMFILSLVLYIINEFKFLTHYIKERRTKMANNGTTANIPIGNESQNGKVVQSKTRGKVISPINDVQITFFAVFIVVIMVPALAYHVGYRQARSPKFYSVIINDHRQSSFAVVRRTEDVTFALSYKDSVFTDTLLILNSTGIDTLALKRKHIEFNDNSKASPYQKITDKLLHFLHFDFMKR